MILLNGKFYDSDGNLVPLLFGNVDQIKLLEKIKILTNEGFAARIRETTKRGWYLVGITCICGSRNEKLANEITLDTGYLFKCTGCKIHYSATPSESSEFIQVIKMKKHLPSPKQPSRPQLF